MLLSSRACAACTALGVRLGCDARDLRKVLSWMLGRNGSVGHAAAMFKSLWAGLEADMAGW